MRRPVSAALVLAPLVAVLPSQAADPIAPRPLAYVESSTGLVPPTLDGGGTELEMGDVNGDGRLDLVSVGDHGSPFVNTDQHGVMVWLGDGAGGFGVVMTGDLGYGGVALGDLDGDGLLDVAYGIHHDYSSTDLGDQLLEVALGDGTGAVWTPWDDGLASNGETWGMFSTDLADVDNDGDLDVASNSFGCCAGVHVYLNQGDGTWVQSFGFLGGNSTDELVLGDVNGDGNADIAVSQQYGTVYLGDGEGGFVLDEGNLPAAPSSGRLGISLGDVDDDGRDDLAFRTLAGGLEVWSWSAPGIWQSLSGDLPSSGPWQATQLVDMDRDGHVDLCAFGSGQGRVWAGDGAGGWTEIASFATPSPGGFEAFRAGGDLDHNGYPDIVLVADEGTWPSERNHLHVLMESSTPAALAVDPVWPRGGETLIAGAVVFLDWLAAIPAGGPGTVDLELSLDGPAGPWMPIASGVVNSGRFQWRIHPATRFTADARIRVTLTVGTDTAVATTPDSFTILGGDLLFTDTFESGDTTAWSATFP